MARLFILVVDAARLRARHPDARVRSRREFQRMRPDRQESDPRQGFRCC